jgi:gp16 family phage-associated protein
MSWTWTERERVKRWFEAHGVSVTDWAVAHGFEREAVYDVLNGRTKGRRGAAHRIAVALGIKAVPDEVDVTAGPGDRSSQERAEASASASPHHMTGGRNET